MAAVLAGQVRVAAEAGGRGRQVRHRRERDADLGAVQKRLQQPPDRVATPVAARDGEAAGDRQVDVASGVVEFLRDLGSGLPGADDEHGSVRQLAGVPVAGGVELPDVRREPPGGVRDLRALVRAGRQDDVACGDRARGGVRDEAAVRRGQTGDLHAQPHRRVDHGRVLGQVVDDVGAGHEAVRVGAVVGHAGQQEGEVRGDEAEAVPAVVPAAAEPVAAVDHQMADAGAGQVMAGGQARLPGSDDQRADLLHGRLPVDVLPRRTLGIGGPPPRREDSATQPRPGWADLCRSCS